MLSLFVGLFVVFNFAYTDAAGVCAGCPRKMAMDEILGNEFLMSTLDKAVDVFNAKDGRRNVFRTVRHSIIGGTSQVVAGAMYRIKVGMIESSCKNIEENEGKGIEVCPAKADSKVQLCTVAIWSRPWKTGKERAIINISC